MESKPSVHIYLIRHGLTAYNQDKKYLGHSDIPVIRDSLAELYGRLLPYFMEKKVDRIVSSDLLRCRQTAEYLFPDQEIILDKRLREINFGDWEGSTYEELKDDHVYSNWLSAWKTECIPNGESWPIFHDRVQNFVQSLFLMSKEVDANIAIVTHKGVIRELFSLLAPIEDYWSIDAEFGKLYTITLIKEDDKWTYSHHEKIPD